MNTKSSIQILTELMDKKMSFETHLRTLNEQYNIVNNVFVCTAIGSAQELKEGYYGEVATYDTLAEALSHFDICLHGIRVHDGKFSVGNLYKNLSDVTESLCIDLAEAKIISE